PVHARLHRHRVHPRWPVQRQFKQHHRGVAVGQLILRVSTRPAYLFSTWETFMRQFAKNVVKFVKAEDGPTAVEYAVMLALIIVVCIGTVTTLGGKTGGTFTTTGSALPAGS